MPYIALILNLLLTPLTTTALTAVPLCIGLDHSKQLGPIRDQGATEWCTAFAGADQLEYYAKKNNITLSNKGSQVSAVALALRHSGANNLKDRSFRQNYIAYSDLKTQLSANNNKYFPLADKIHDMRQRAANRNPNYKTLKKQLESVVKEQTRFINSSFRDRGRGDMPPSYLGDPTYLNLNIKLLEIRSAMNKIYESEPQNNPKFTKLLDDFNSLQIDRERIANDLDTIIASLTNNGLNAKNAITTLINNPICMESDVSSQTQYHLSYGVSTSAMQAKKYAGITFILRIDEYIGLFMQNLETPCEVTSTNLGSMFKTNLSLISDAIQSTDPINNLLTQTCKNSYQLTNNEKPQIDITTISNGANKETDLIKAFEHINSSINSGNIIGASFATEMLKPESTGSHYALITGKVDCGQGPFYIIRNSWGKDACVNSLRKHIQENKPHIYTLPLEFYSTNQAPFACTEDGNYIVRETELRKHIKSVTELKHPGQKPVQILDKRRDSVSISI
jgi:uncharacterized protein YdcH (DUF465 family)